MEREALYQTIEWEGGGTVADREHCCPNVNSELYTLAAANLYIQ
jgi:hypothetical protein